MAAVWCQGSGTMSIWGEGLYEDSAQSQSPGAPMHRYCIKFPEGFWEG